MLVANGSGDYFVADWDMLRRNPESEPKAVRVHRIAEVIPLGRLTSLSFPLADYRYRQRVVGLGPADPDGEDMFERDPEDIPLEESGEGILPGLEGADPLRGMDPDVDGTRGLGLYDETGQVLVRRNVRRGRRTLIPPRGPIRAAKSVPKPPKRT